MDLKVFVQIVLLDAQRAAVPLFVKHAFLDMLSPRMYVLQVAQMESTFHLQEEVVTNVVLDVLFAQVQQAAINAINLWLFLMVCVYHNVPLELLTLLFPLHFFVWLVHKAVIFVPAPQSACPAMQHHFYMIKSAQIIVLVELTPNINPVQH